MAIRKIKRKEFDNLMNDDQIKYTKPIKNQYIAQNIILVNCHSNVQIKARFKI